MSDKYEILMLAAFLVTSVSLMLRAAHHFGNGRNVRALAWLLAGLAVMLAPFVLF